MATLTRPNRTLSEEERAARREDIDFMAEHGETTYGAAKRLGLTENALGAWCRNNYTAGWSALLVNNARRFGDGEKGPKSA